MRAPRGIKHASGFPRHAAIARDRPSRYGKKRHPFTEGPVIARAPGPVSQDRLILTRSGSGEPELQRWARCAPQGG